MPFCRECGKEVQEDWISCPYCAATIGEPAIISIQDSAVIGDVSINDSQAISNAMKESSKCVSCGSIGAVQITCRECGKMACCSVCKEDIDNKRVNQFSKQIPEEGGKMWQKDVRQFVKLRYCSECYERELLDPKRGFGQCSKCSRWMGKSQYSCHTDPCSGIGIFGTESGRKEISHSSSDNSIFGGVFDS